MYISFFLSIERSEKNNVWSSFDISFFFKCVSDIYSSSQQKHWTFWRLSLLFAQTYSSVFFHISHAFIEERSNDDFSEKRKNCSDQIFKPLLRCLWLHKTVSSNCKMFLKRFKDEIFNWNVRRLCVIEITRNWFEQMTKSALEKRLRKQFQDSFGLKALPHHFLFSE